MNYLLLGCRIRQMRVRRHVSQQQMARELHFSQQHICNVERGLAHPSIDFLVDISNALNVSTDYLLQDSLNQKNTDEPGNVLSDVQCFLDKQKLEIQTLQNILHDD